ncbi:MAG: MFS transporter, partial [Gammaproteobacteria bacterium]|nr:MFS transporter [Gammaproteobacteria bacterium]
MTKAEMRAVSVLAGIFGLRMFGLFLVLPVLALYADRLAGATPMLIGLALGAYGLTQAVLQIPYGLVSDRLGRKPVIVFGLLVFALGSVVAAAAHTVEWMIAGRALQGAGAIAAVVLALTADLTREEQRPKAMALIGMSIGLAFLLALMAGPLLAGWVGVPGLFWFTAGLALAAIVLLLGFAPTPVQARHHDVQTAPPQILNILKHPHLFRLNCGVFFLHLVLTSMFVAVPVALTREVGFAVDSHWQIYVPVLLLSVATMLPLLFLASRKSWMPRVFIGSVAILLAGEVLLVFGFRSFPGLVVALWVFFWGFNTLEALLPSL